MKKRFLHVLIYWRYSIVIILLFPFFLYSQKVTISGMLKDALNGESLHGAYVAFRDTTEIKEVREAISNKSGFFSVTVDVGIYEVIISFLGYEEYKKIHSFSKNEVLKVELKPVAIRTDEVVVTAKREDHNISGIEVGKMEMKIETIKSLPALFGEVDVLKSIQLLPGIQFGGEGNSGFYVRGGSADQNLILLDEATIYNAGHLFGFFSVFNPDAVKNVEVTKSGMPAYYGGRLASIVDVSQKEGNMKKFEVDGGIGLISSRLTVQGPIKKEKCSFLISGRRTYIDVLIQPFLKSNSPLKGTKFYFYDLNAKMNIILNDKHRLYLGGYFGKDVYGFKSFSGTTFAQMGWRNGIASLRWNYIITPQLFLNTSATFSDYHFNTKMGMDVYEFNLFSGVRDYGLKTELTYLPAIPHLFKFGIHYIYHTFFPNSYEVEAGDLNQLSIPMSKPYYAHDLSLYANDEFSIVKWLKVNLGVRYNLFAHTGKFTRYMLDDFNNIVDSLLYRRGECVKAYNSAEPRLSLRFLLDSNTSIKASYTLNFQYIHQVSLAGISLPTDVWMPSTDIIKPQLGNQFSIGIFRNFYKNMFETYIDFYYKSMKNLIEYKDGMDMTVMTMNPDQTYAFGKGWAYGMEVFIKKRTGRLTGFIGYTLAFSQRKFDELNNGKTFYSKYDRRHDITINLGYEIVRNKLMVSTVWVFASGNTMTIPIGFYFFGGTMMTEYSERNAFRVPPYHRLDLSLNWIIKESNKFKTELNLSVYNVYNRMNPFFVFFETDNNVSQDFTEFNIHTKAYQMSLFPILPSLSWNFKF